MDLDFILVQLKVINAEEAIMATTSYSAVTFEYKHSASYHSVSNTLKILPIPEKWIPTFKRNFFLLSTFWLLQCQKNAPEVNVQMKNMFLQQR